MSTLGLCGVLGRVLGGSGRLGVTVHIEADNAVPVHDYQVTDFAAVVIGDLRHLEACVRIALEDLFVSLTFGIEFAVCQFDINERAGVKFTADPDVKAGTFEGRCV